MRTCGNTKSFHKGSFLSTYSKPRLVNYLSRWIANLGVVPFVRFWAFLLDPIFFLRLDLFVFVTLVFETISALLILLTAISKQAFNNFKYLSNLGPHVKTKLSLSLFFLVPVLASCNVYSSTYKTIILAKGEHYTIAAPNLKQFTLGNPEVLKAKFQERKKSLWLKAIGLGFSEVLVWEKKKTSYHVYVLDRRVHMAQAAQLALIQNKGLKVNIKGGQFLITGRVAELDTLMLLKKIQEKLQLKISLQLTLTPGLKKIMMAELISYLFSEGLQEFNCYIIGVFPECSIPHQLMPSKVVLKHLKSKWPITIVPRFQTMGLNYKLELKLFLISFSKDTQQAFGAQKIEGPLKNFIKTKLYQPLENNTVIYKGEDISVETMASPTILITLDNEAELSLGAEVPFQQKETSPVFKFAGLKIKTLLKGKNGHLYLQYQVELTRPGVGQMIGGLKKKSQLRLNLGQKTDLFQLNYRSMGKEKVHLPTLGKIPLLGQLFSYNAHQSNIKNIYATVTLKKEE